MFGILMNSARKQPTNNYENAVEYIIYTRPKPKQNFTELI